MSVLVQSTACITVLMAGVAVPLTTVRGPDSRETQVTEQHSARRMDRKLLGDLNVGLLPAEGIEGRFAILTLYLLQAPRPGRDGPAAHRRSGPIDATDLLPDAGAAPLPTDGGRLVGTAAKE